MLKQISGMLVMSLLAVSCSQQAANTNVVSQSGEGIIGGKKVEDGTPVARSTVALYDSKVSALCTGTLITRNIVITAAHCVDPKDSSQLSVIFAKDVEKSKKEERRPALKVVAHTSYDPNRVEDTYDIALVRFDGELPEGYGPAPLLGDFDQVVEGAKITVAGYGLSWAWGIKRGSGTLKETNVVVKEPHYGQTEIMLDQSFNNGVCSGDSGGPAYYEKDGRLYLVAVTSRVGSFPIPLMPKCSMISIFTRVDAHKVWIVSNSQDLSLL